MEKLYFVKKINHIIHGSSGNASYGNCVKIRHDNGMYTLYAHLADVRVNINQYVSQGQDLGMMGNTGNSYGIHLHFEVFNTNNSRVNPENYFILFFAVLVVICISFFKREDYLNSKNKKTGFLKVRDQEIIIGKESNFKKGKSLFLKVSIIAFLNK